MINNVEHLAYVHYHLAQKVFPTLDFDWLNKAHSVLVVLIFEIVVITLVMEGKHAFAGLFTCCIFILSEIYYDVPELVISERFIDVIAASTYSLIFTISIYMFSRLLADKYADDDARKSLIDTIYGLRTELAASQSQVKQHESGLNAVKSALNDIKSQLIQRESELKEAIRSRDQMERTVNLARERLKCPYCSRQNDNEAQLRAHKGHCESNPRNRNS